MAMAGDIADVKMACPFCACTTIKHNDDGDSGWLVCDWCGATGPYSDEDAAAGLTIEQAWDKRMTPTCPDCGGSGLRDSGGVYPWGEAILVPCDCAPMTPTPQDRRDPHD